MKDPVVLKVYRGKRLIAVKQFLNPQIIIGRQNDSGLTLDDEMISPLHAVIEEYEEGYSVTDMGSVSGISVEGERVLERKLQSGEAIEIGPYSIRFYIGAPHPPIVPNYEKEHEPPIQKSREENKSDAENLKSKDSEKTVFEADLDETTKIENTKQEFEEQTKVESLDQGIDQHEEDLPDLPVDPDGHVSFSDEEESEVTDPGVYVERNEKTSPGFEVPPMEVATGEDVVAEEAAGVKIESRDVDEALEAQKIEPISSGYVAPKSTYDDIDEIIYPYSRGSVLEVVVAWQERVIKTYHYTNSETIYLTNDRNPAKDIYAPLIGSKFRYKLISFGSDCIVNIAQTMSGEIYYDNKKEELESYSKHSSLIKTVKSGHHLQLDQGQMVRLNLMSDKVSAYIRFVEDTAEAAKAPVFDFSSSELVGIFMSIVSVLIIALYMLFYVPGTMDNTKDLLEDRLTKAVITFKPPPKITRVEPPKPEPVPPVVKPKVVKVTEVKKKTTKPKSQIKAGRKAGDGSKKTGKAKAAAPSRVKTKNKVGSSRPGGSVNTGKSGANMASKKKDLSKTGILGVLSGGGAHTALDKASSGVGATIGLADEKTGFQGQASDQAGSGIGTKLQKAGQGGSGSSLAGVGDLKTSGRGGGQAGYGTGGLGGKGTSTILTVDGAGGEFSSNIDKDAIRRLIRRNRNALAGCYERALDRNSNVSGKVVLSWRIINGGKMISPKVKSSTLNNSQVEQCIINRLMVLRFPDPGPNEIAEVDYPFVFKPSN